MSSLLLRRCLSLLFRLLLGWLLVAVVVELAMTGPRSRGEVVGGQSLRLLRELVAGEVPESLAAAGAGSWRSMLGEATVASLEALAIAVVVTLAFGPVFGVLAARWRRHAWVEILLAPFFAAAWLPGFWLAGLAVWLQFHFWNQPGFSDPAPASGGPVAWEPLWRLVLVAVPVALGAIGWQMRSVAGTLKRAAREPHVRAAQVRGLGGGVLFYRHVFRNSLEPLIRSLDRILPAMLGMQLLVEWALRFPGLGRLVIESARAPEFAGLLASGLILATVVVAVRWAGETASRLVTERNA